MKLTYTIQVCNESRELFSLLNFLLKVKDEGDPIDVVIDSTHKTEKIDMVIEYFKQDINVYERPFDTFYKNGLYHDSVATGDYIFHIDADEIPEEFLIRNVKKIIQDTNAEILFIPRMNIHPGITEEFAKECKFNVNNVGWINWPDYQGRIYKNCEHITWTDELHTKLTGSDKVIRLQPEVRLGMWHIKSMEKQTSRWKKVESGDWPFQRPSGSLYDTLM